MRGSEKAYTVAAMFGATVAAGSIAAFATALGYPALIEEHAQQHRDSTCMQLNKLLGLPLDPQTK